MKKLCLYICVILFPLVASAQGEAANWFFGKQAGVSFASGNPEAITYSPAPATPINTLEGSSTISDATGNLLFYSDGTRVWNRNHEIMPNGSNLQGHRSSTQSGIIVPNPDDDEIFYIFTVGTDLTGGDPPTGTQGFRVYTVDMSLDGGLGAVVAGSETNLSDGQASRWTEKVTAVRQDECGDYWVISLVDNSNSVSDDYTSSDYSGLDWSASTSWGSTFYAYKVSGSGVDPTPVKSKVPVDANEIKGYLKVSPDGQYLAIANYAYQLTKHAKTFLFTFDLATGEVGTNDDTEFGLLTNQRGLELMSRSDISTYGAPYGIEFDATSRFLYISTHDYNTGGFAGLDGDDEIYILQYDLDAIDVKNSQTSIHYESGNVYRAGLQLSYGNQIFVTVPRSYYTDTQYLDLIEFPYLKGSAANYTESYLDLGPGLATQGLPPFIQSLFLNELNITNNGSIDDNQDYLYLCEGDSYELRYNVNNPSYTYTWYKDGALLASETTRALTISYDGFNETNKYTLEVDKNDGSCPDVGISIVTFSPPPTAGTPSNIFECDDDLDGLFLFDLTGNTASILNGLDPTEYQVQYYTNEADAIADNEPNMIADPTAYQNNVAFTQQTIYARLESTDLASCYEVVEFDINVTSVPEATKPENYVICDDDSDGNDANGQGYFDLSSMDAEILGGLDGTRYNVSYHLSQSDANNDLNQLDKNSDYLSGSITVYVRVENISNLACTDTSVNFDLIVNEKPPLKLEYFAQVDCDNDGLDGADFKDLEDFIDTFLDDNPINYNITFHQTLATAEAGIEPINNPTNYYATTETIYIRFENVTTGCYSIGELSLSILSAEVSNTIEQTLITCDTNQNGINSFDLNELYDAFVADYPYITDSGATVNFYSSELDAQNNTNAIGDWANYNNVIAYDDIVYIRVDNGTCSDFGKYAKLEVEPLPLTSSTVSDMEICDTDIDGFYNDFRLDDARDEIIGLATPGDYDISFYENAADRIADVNRLGDSYTNSIAFGNTIYVRIQDVNTGCVNNNLSFTTTVLPAPDINTSIPLMSICDDDNNGYYSFDFDNNADQSFIQDQILNGLDPLDYTLSYHSSEAQAQNNIDPLSLPYSNATAFGRERIYVRVQDNSSSCFAITSFEIEVNQTPELLPLADYALCDDDDDGNSSNGIIGLFLFETRDELLIPNALERALFDISYHPSLADAQNGTNVINKTLGYTNTTADIQTIYVRVENQNNPTCYETASFNIVVNPLPVILDTNYSFIVCDSNDDGLADYNLNDIINDISADPVNTTLGFYSTELAAINDDTSLKLPANQISSPSRTFFVRHENASGCVDVSTVEVEVVVTQIPASFNLSYENCDLSENGIATFDFSAAQTQLLNDYTYLDQPGVTLQFFDNLSDAQNNTNPIPDISNYTNATSYNQEIFVRVDSQGCFYVGKHIDLIVNPLPLSSAVVNDIEVCDDDFDGFYNDFRLDLVRNDILSGANPADYDIAFYESSSDRLANSNALPDTYTNFNQDGNPIFVRVIDNNTGCINDKISFNVVVNPKPAINFALPQLQICDSDQDGSVSMDFSDNSSPYFMETAILNGLNPADYTITYHSSEAAANAASPIAMPYTNSLGQELIWVRVQNNTTACISITYFDLQVNPAPTLMPLTDYQLCDDDSDLDATNGRVSSFVLSSKDAELIINPVERDLFNISYHPSLVDAQNNTNVINKNLGYTNATPNNQTIFVRIENKNDPSCYQTSSFDLIVNPLPVILEPNYQWIICDTDNNAKADFDLNDIIPQITSDPVNTTIRFFSSEVAAWNNDSSLELPANQSNSSSRTFFVRHENASGCVDVSTVEVEIVVSRIPSSIQQQIELCDLYESEVQDDTDGISLFDLSGFDNYLSNYFSAIPNISIEYYETEQDAINKVNPINNLNSYRNKPSLENGGIQQIWTRVENFIDGNLVEECVYIGTHLSLEVIPIPSFVQIPQNIELCDDDFDGQLVFDLKSKREELEAQNPDFSVSFYLNQNDANAKINALGDTHQSFGERIFIRLENRSQQDDSGAYCPNLSYYFDLIVKPLPVAEQLEDQEYCQVDPLSSLMINLHDFDNLIVQNLGSDYTVRYYLSELEARNNSNEIGSLGTDFDFSTENATIWYRVQQSGVGDACYSVYSFNLFKRLLPTINDIGSYAECASFDGTQQFNLGEVAQAVLGIGQINAGLFDIEYFDSANQLITSNDYIVTSNETIMLKISNKSFPQCETLVDVDLEIAPIPEVLVEDYEYILCDDDLDGIMAFDLTAIEAEITVNPSTTNLKFYTDENDAINDINALLSPSNFVNTDFSVIYVRHENGAQGDCFAISQVSLRAALYRFDESIRQTLYACEIDANNPGFALFDISAYDTAVKNLFPSDQPIEISHFYTREDAEANINAIPPTSYKFLQNTIANQQFIYTRAQNSLAPECSLFVASYLTLEVNPSPELIDYTAEICFDPDNGLSFPSARFNLEDYYENIVASGSISGLEIVFYETFTLASIQANPIDNPTNYINKSQDQVLFARVRDINTDCYSISKLTLHVNELPEVPAVLSKLELCDVSSIQEEINDGVYEIDNFLPYISDELFANVDNASNYNLGYYNTLVGAENADFNDRISIPYPVEIGEKSIFIRVEDDRTGCAVITELKTELFESANPVQLGAIEVCDSPELLSSENDGIFTFQLMDYISDILANQNNPADFEVSLYTSQADADQGDNQIDLTEFVNTTPYEQRLFVRVENKTNSSCINTSTYIDLRVKTIPNLNYFPDSVSGCDVNQTGTYNFNLEDLKYSISSDQSIHDNISWYTSEEGAKDIGETTNSIPKSIYTNYEVGSSTIWARVSVEGCYRFIPVTLKVNSLPYLTKPSDLSLCDYSENIDLSVVSSEILAASNKEDLIINYYSTVEDASNNINIITAINTADINSNIDLYVKIFDAKTGCESPNIESFNISINPIPEFEIFSPIVFCDDSEEIFVNIEQEDQPGYIYTWKDENDNTINPLDADGKQVRLTEAGMYTVIAENPQTGCVNVKFYEAKISSIAKINQDDLIISDDVDGSKKVIIEETKLGLGDYEFSLSEFGPYQDQGVFENLQPGTYTIFIQDKNGCATASVEVTLLDFPRFFTPSGQGNNGKWNVRGIYGNSAIPLFQSGEIEIFDRYGKFITKISIYGEGWDGTDNGVELLPTDYWYYAKMVDQNGKVREYQGHFSLLK